MPDPWEVRMRGVPVGPGIHSPGFDEVMAAIGSAPDPADWETVAGFLLPVFPRRRPFPFGAPEPLRVRMPPGVLVSFGIDLGPAIAYVHEDMLARWPVSPDGLAAIAVANLRGRLRDVGPASLATAEIDGVWTRILQTGLGIASTAVLVPDELRRIFGTTPQRFIAPMRDLLLSLPLDSRSEVAAAIVEDLAERDPNALAVESFVLENGEIRCEALGPAVGAA
jgi:hypothetical protein